MKTMLGYKVQKEKEGEKEIHVSFHLWDSFKVFCMSLCYVYVSFVSAPEDGEPYTVKEFNQVSFFQKYLGYA